MSQHDFNIANQGFPAFRADLNDGLAALASNSAGTAEPTTTYAYQFWYDETSDLLKMRNGADDAWITLAYFDQTNDEWEIRSAVIQAVDSAGVVIKTDDGTTRITVADNGNVTITNQLTVSDGLIVDNDGATVATFDRATSDGTIAEFQKDGSIVGSIGAVSSDLFVGTGDTGVRFLDGSNAYIPYNPSTNSTRNNAIDLGIAAGRFKDLYLSGGVYLGGTGSANKLDDYEEGTWTPTVNSGTVTVNRAKYTKTGNLVTVICELTLGGTRTGSVFEVAGLPFSVVGTSPGSLITQSYTGSGEWVSSLPISTTSLIRFQNNGGDSIGTHFGNGYFLICASYHSS